VLIAPVLAIITAADPLVSIGIARIWLDESFASSPLALAGEAVSLAVMTGGIIALAHRAPQVAQREIAQGVSSPELRRPAPGQAAADRRGRAFIGRVTKALGYPPSAAR